MAKISIKVREKLEKMLKQNDYIYLMHSTIAKKRVICESGLIINYDDIFKTCERFNIDRMLEMRDEIAWSNGETSLENFGRRYKQKHGINTIIFAFPKALWLQGGNQNNISDNLIQLLLCKKIDMCVNNNGKVSFEQKYLIPREFIYAVITREGDFSINKNFCNSFTAKATQDFFDAFRKNMGARNLQGSSRRGYNSDYRSAQGMIL